jgi:Skp family chaperone for outer membrane proteins
MTDGGSWSELMEETLKEILRTLQDYGDILKHIDARFDTMEKMIELVRSNQSTINERENALERQCQEHHARVDDTLQSLARRIASLENRLSPIPYSALEASEEGG